MGLLVNTLAPDEKYPVLNSDNLTIPIQMKLYQKKKLFLDFLLHFSNLDSNLKISKKKMTLIYFVFPKLPSPKTESYKRLKIPVWNDSSTCNMVNVAKYYWNLHRTSFIIYNDHCQENWVGKSLSYWYAKSRDCLLTHWLQITSILFLIERI